MRQPTIADLQQLWQEVDCHWHVRGLGPADHSSNALCARRALDWHYHDLLQACTTLTRQS